MEGEEPRNWQDALHRIEDGAWKGWWTFAGFDAFEDLIGPFYFRRGEDGQSRCAFRAEARHMNGAGFMHGGCLMSFADFALFVIAGPALAGGTAVTATFNAEFVGSVYAGQLVECTGEVIKAGRSLVFVRGLIRADGEPALSFSGTLKKVTLRQQG